MDKYYQSVANKYRELTLLLIRRKLTITTMESATAGEIASLLTDTEGSSAILKGAFITYSNEAKCLQGVDPDIIARYGVYSKETAAAMAEACRKAYRADIAIGITGTFGNVDPANGDSVPGEIHYAISQRGKVKAYTEELPAQDSRRAYKYAAAELVADRLLEDLKEQERLADRVKLIGLDMDGTLLNSKKELPPDFYSWVKAHPTKKVVIASGRQYYTLRDNMAEIIDDVILMADNGAFVFYKGEMLYSDYMTKAHTLEILRKVSAHPNYYPVLCCEHTAYMPDTTPDYILEITSEFYHRLTTAKDLTALAEKYPSVKIAVFVEDRNAEAAMETFEDLPAELRHVLSGDSWIDIANASVNKGAALAAIRKEFAIAREESMAFGDFLNDASLIDSVEESYAMDNGHPLLKDMAKYVTASNDEDGVMKILRLMS